MGIVVNAIKEAGSLSQVGVPGSGSTSSSAIAKFNSSSPANLRASLKNCPVVRESRDVLEGMAQGDAAKVTANAGMLALAMVTIGGASQVGFKQASMLSGASASQSLRAAAFLATSQTFKGGAQQSLHSENPTNAGTNGGDGGAASTQAGESNSPTSSGGGRRGSREGGTGSQVLGGRFSASSALSADRHRPKTLGQLKHAILDGEGRFMYAQIEIKKEGYESKIVIRGLKKCSAPHEILEAFQREEMSEIPEEEMQGLEFDLVGTGVIKRQGTKLFIYGKEAFDPAVYKTKTILEAEKLYEGFEILVCDSVAISLERLREGDQGAPLRTYGALINDAYNDVTLTSDGVAYPKFDPNRNFMKDGVCDFQNKYSYGAYNEVLSNISDDPSGLDGCLLDLREAFRTGETKDIRFRRQQLQRLQNGLEEMKDELCQAVERDVGRGSFFTYVAEIASVKGEIQHTLDHLSEWIEPTAVDTPVIAGPGRSYIKPEPLGVISVLAAWNYPVFTLIGPLQGVIAAGNCALLKPSELAPNSSLALVKLCRKYLDQKFYKVYQGKGEVAKAICSMRFDMLVFTGSTQKGKLVAQAAAKNLVPCLLELGGKSPCIVDESADATFSAKKILFGKLPNYGQVCVAPDYVFLHESKTQEFIQSLRENLKSGYKNGEVPADSGKVINEFHYNRVCDLLKDHGGEIVIGNKNAAVDRDLKPTVILNPSPDAPVMKEEIFGPILPVFTYSNIQEAIRYITEEQEKPLVLYYFGRDKDVAHRVENETSSGGLVVNDTCVHLLNSDLPFGGVGFSGQGRYHGVAGFKTFSNMKSVLVKPVLDMFPFDMINPPYADSTKSLLLKSLRFGHYTQDYIVRRLFYFFFLIPAMVLSVVFRQKLRMLLPIFFKNILEKLDWIGSFIN